ncbi:MAG: DUF1343 domain-containing protein [Longimicrobiales bacterium]
MLACAPSGDAADAAASAGGAVQEEPARAVRPGVDVLLSDSLHLVRGRRVGLVTNHTGRDADGRSSIDRLAEHPEVELVALYSPEHGIRGEEEAGAHIDSSVDAATGLPVHSLYGQTRRPTPEMLEGVEALVFDMQDIGARYYTYVSTMAYAMEAAGTAGIPFVVLDRPNPIRGDVVQGNVLDTAYSTFVGLYPVPMRHGMTPGELARMYAGEFGVEATLHVVPAAGWRRDVPYDGTGLPWVPPSPNMPTLESALAYPGTCLFEGTPLSVGRGTDHAFQWVGAPWLDGAALADALNAYGLEGVRFEPATFTPRNPGDGKFPDTEVYGVRLVPTATDYDASRAAVAILVETYRAAGDRWSWREAHFDRLAGTDALRLGVIAGQDVATLTSGWPDAVAAFERRRAPYLIY